MVMNVLRRVLRDPGVCELTADGMKVCGRAVDGAAVVRFGGTETKGYTLEQVLFYLMHREQKYTVYMGLCKERGIGKIYYTDQKAIVDEIAGSKEEALKDVEIDGCTFRYFGSRGYGNLKGVCGRNEVDVHYVIVPSSVSSIVNLGNAERFLKDGWCGGVAVMDERVEVSVEIDGMELSVKDDVEGFVPEDWKNVVAVFLDGSRWQVNTFRLQNAFEVLREIPTFYLARKGMEMDDVLRRCGAVEIPVRGNAVSREDLGLVIKKIRERARGR